MTVQAANNGTGASSDAVKKKLRTLLVELRDEQVDPLLRIILRAYIDNRFGDPDIRAFIRNLVSFSDSENPEQEKVDFLVKTLPAGKLKEVLKKVVREGPDTPRNKLLLQMLGGSNYASDLVSTMASELHFDDENFVRAYDAGASISVWGADIRWRVHTLLHCASQAARIDGDFVECGVDRGGTAMSVIASQRPEVFESRKFYLFDTFKGLVREQMTKEEIDLNKTGDERYPDVLDEVTDRFDEYNFVKIVPGVIPDTLSEFTGDKIAYLHIDLNVAYPECAAFEHFWPFLSEGAPVIFDDYGFPLHVEQRKALDDTARKLGTQIMSLPTGQGLLWK